MKQEKWHEDQPVLKDDLDRASDTKAEAIRERHVDLFNPGVLRDSQLAGETEALLIAQGPTAGLFITVNTGVAISPIGERIVIPAVSTFNAAAVTTTTDDGIGGTTVTPQSTGSQNIPVVNGTNYIWVGYLETTDATVFSLSNVTNKRLFIKRNDGFEINVTTSTTNPDASRFVLLGEVVASGGSVTSINVSNTIEQQVLSTVIPATPYELTLPPFANLPAEAGIPVAIPTVSRTTLPGPTATATMTFVNTVGAPGGTDLFSVDFKTGKVTFDSSNTGASVTITYNSIHTRRAFATTRTNRVSGNISVIDRPATYAAGTTVTLTDHVSSRGSGTTSPTNPHGISASDIGLAGIENLGAQLGSSGVIVSSGDYSSTVSMLSPGAVSAATLLDNKVTIAPLASGESVNMSGVIITPANISATATFTFENPSSPGSPLAAGVYTFYIDPTTRTVKRTAAGGTPPSGSFLIASITWQVVLGVGSLLLPITDLRLFGTTAAPNIRLETMAALSIGLASSTKTSKFYRASLTGTTSITAPTYAFTASAGTTLNLTIDGTLYPVTLPGSPANITIDTVVTTINTAIGTAGLALRTPDNKVKLLAPVSLVITSGTAAPILGFPVSPAAGSSDSGDIKEIIVAGNNASTGSMGKSNAIEVILTYDTTPAKKLTTVTSRVGNKDQTTTITYNTDDTIKSVDEQVS